MNKQTCCFIGHRKIIKTETLVKNLYSLIENLITQKQVDTFLFGSKSQFNDLCLEIVSDLKAKYPFIKRVYVRAEYEEIDDIYLRYLRESYEDTYYPDTVKGAGRAVYLKRNFEMINRSEFCVFYYRDDYSPQGRKSGTKEALIYAFKMNKKFFIFDQ